MLRHCLALGLVVAAAQPALAEADKGAKITVGWAGPFDTLNPATTGARNVGPIGINIFDTLVWLTPDFQLTPGLATKWEVSEDKQTYTFTLKQGVTFHDGTPFDADAVVANFDYIGDKTTQSKISLSLLGSCATAKAVSKYVVEVSCTKPYAPLLAQLGEPYLGMQSPKAIKEYGQDLGLHPVGTGPFSFVSYVAGQNLVLKRNDDYKWNPAATKFSGPPDIAQITFQIVSSPQARVSQFQAGQSEVIQDVPGVFWNALTKMNRFTALPVPISGMGIFAPINAGFWPTDDVRVRQAILYAVDRKGVEQLADAGAYPISNTPLVKGMVGYDEALETAYPFDPARAEALLKEAGWTKPGEFWEKGGKRLAIKLTAISTSTSYPPLALAIQGYLRKVGIDASVEQMATPAWLAANINGQSSMAPCQYIAVDPDALRLWFTPDQYFNWSHFTDPALTKLLADGQQELDPAKRLPIYAQAQKIIMDNAIELPIRQNIDLVMTTKKLTGLTYSGGGFEYFGAASMAK
ncbi:MAG: ABC transporter substrate-binding protein [Janthinobacterium lividum]